MNTQPSTPLHPAVLKLLLAAAICALLGISLWGYGAYQQQAAQAARAAAQATAVAISNQEALAQATATEAAAQAQATAVQGQQDADATEAAGQYDAAQAAATQATATAQAFVDQGTALTSLPAGQCVVGMPNHDMRIAVSGNGAQTLCQSLVQWPSQGIGPLTDETSNDTYEPTAVTLSLNDGTPLRVVCQYNLPSTTVRVFDDGLTARYGTAYCNGITLDGVSGVAVG